MGSNQSVNEMIPSMADLGSTVLIGSGAIGTMLRAAHDAETPLVETRNLQAPETVRALHRAYRAAGSRVLVTNTFAANPVLLAEAGVEAESRAVNEAGVAAAREAAEGQCLVWASVGPLSLGLRLDDFSHEQLLRAYSEQCEALRGADAILLETFVEPREAAAALDAACATGLPVIFQVGNTGRGASGWRRIDALLALASKAGARAIGANCRHPDEIVEVVRYLAARTPLPITAAPNAGTPSIDRGRVTYAYSPDAFLEVARTLCELGVAVVGGCCGTTPDHVARIASALSGRPVASRGSGLAVAGAALSPAAPRRAPGNRVRELIASDSFLVSVEIRAERASDLAAICEGAAEVARAGADMFDVPDKPGATVGRDAAVVAARVQDATGVPSICHKAAIHGNLLDAHSAMIGCWDLGVQGILAVTGDPPSIGPLGALASRVNDLKSSVELLRLVRTLRGGATMSGEPIGDPPDLCAGCTIGRAIPAHVEWLRRKLDAGAEFVFSQPAFEADDIRRLQDAVGRLGVRLFPGIMPLANRRNAESLASGRIPGIRIPDALVQAFARFESREDQRKFGVEHALGLARVVAAEARGLYLIMPFGKSCYADAADMVRTIRSWSRA